MFKQSVTIFQAHKLNKSILNNLISYNLKLNFREKPDYKDYTQIYERFLNIHPDNSKVLISSYPELVVGGKNKIFLNDLKLLGPKEFDRLRFLGPLVADFNNSLLGNDIHTIDRILHNFDHNSQVNDFENSIHQPVIDNRLKGKLSEFNNYINSKKLKNNGFNLIHPHAAEFADLY